MGDYTTTNLRFAAGVYAELQYQARRRGASVASLVREAVAQYLGHGAPSDHDAGSSEPFERLIGAVDVDATDESVNHDHYLYGWSKDRPREDARGHRRAAGAGTEKG